MSKILDYNIIESELVEILEDSPSPLQEVIGYGEVVRICTQIYLANDVQKAIAFDYPDTLSIIASKQRISIIGCKVSSYYKAKEPICTYDNLTDDLQAINIYLTAAYDRWINLQYL